MEPSKHDLTRYVACENWTMSSRYSIVFWKSVFLKQSNMAKNGEDGPEAPARFSQQVL